MQNNSKVLQAIQELKNYIEPKIGHKIKGLTRRDLLILSEDLFSTCDDLIGHRVDQLIAIMEENHFGVVP